MLANGISCDHTDWKCHCQKTCMQVNPPTLLSARKAQSLGMISVNHCYWSAPAEITLLYTDEVYCSVYSFPQDVAI